MWGNRLGWGISAGMAIVVIGVMVLLQIVGTTPSDMTAAFKNDPANLAPLALPIAPETVLATMTDSCDAADKYREAIEEYLSNHDIYDRFDAKNVDQMKAVELVMEAAKCKDMTLFTKDAAKVINFDREKTSIEVLRRIGGITAAKALNLADKKDYDGARKDAEGAFALGAKMYNERVVWEEFEAGLAVMGSAAGAMARIAADTGDTSRAKAAQAFAQSTAKFTAPGSRVHELRSITKSIDGDTCARRAGDVFALAQKSQERMWRVEACLQLARTKRNVGEEGRAADPRHAQMLLRRLAEQDKDPIVRIAAVRARDITDIEYNKQ